MFAMTDELIIHYENYVLLYFFIFRVKSLKPDIALIFHIALALTVVNYESWYKYFGQWRVGYGSCLLEFLSKRAIIAYVRNIQFIFMHLYNIILL